MVRIISMTSEESRMSALLPKETALSLHQRGPKLNATYPTKMHWIMLGNREARKFWFMDFCSISTSHSERSESAEDDDV